MNNLEWLNKMRKKTDDHNSFIKHRKPYSQTFASEHDIKYRKMKALEIIAEELINIRTKMESDEGVTVDVRMS